MLKYSIIISCNPSVYFSARPMMIITEFMENGSLDNFLKVRKHDYDYNDDDDGGDGDGGGDDYDYYDDDDYYYDYL